MWGWGLGTHAKLAQLATYFHSTIAHRNRPTSREGSYKGAREAIEAS